jgi:hypothetical protein
MSDFPKFCAERLCKKHIFSDRISEIASNLSWGIPEFPESPLNFGQNHPASRLGVDVYKLVMQPETRKPNFPMDFPTWEHTRNFPPPF